MTRPVAQDLSVDGGVAGLCLVARFFGIMADPDEVARRYILPGPVAGKEDLVCGARQMGFKTRLVTSHWDRLEMTPLRAIVCLKDGRFLVAGRFGDGKILVHDTAEGRPRLSDQAGLEPIWSGQLILVDHRADLAAMARTSGIRWFLTAVRRYRRVLGEVLVALFLPELLGLVSPLFFQVAVDSVLVHRGLSTLDVLMVGLAIILIFEVTLGALRTYVLSHTVNRIDVELRARVFDHLLALPIAYFGSRRVGRPGWAGWSPRIRLCRPYRAGCDRNRHRGRPPAARTRHGRDRRDQDRAAAGDRLCALAAAAVPA